MNYVSRLVIPSLVIIAGLSLLAPARADDEKAKTGSITGTVMGLDGKPAADITVRLMQPPARRPGGPGPATRPAAEPNIRPPEGNEPGDKAPPGGGGGRQMPAPIKTTKSDAEGKFTMDDVAPGEYLVLAGEMRSGPRGRARATVKAGETATVEIKLMPPRERPAPKQ